MQTISKHYCMDCRYWTPPDKDHWPKTEFGQCGMCGGSGANYYYGLEAIPDVKDTLAYADTDNLSAWFRTKSNFGCVQWKGKESKPK